MGSAGTIGHGAVLLARMDWRILWASLGLVVALVLGAVIIGMVERWRKRPADAGLTPNDQLSHFRRLYDEGTITREEFEQIRTQLADKIRDQLKIKPAAPEQPPAPPGPPGPAQDGFRPG